MERIEELEFLSELDKKKFKIFKDLKALNSYIDEAIFMLKTEVWQHNVSVDLIALKRKIDLLIENLKEEEKSSPNQEEIKEELEKQK